MPDTLPLARGDGPARVLREVEAKRKILAEHPLIEALGERDCGTAVRKTTASSLCVSTCQLMIARIMLIGHIDHDALDQPTVFTTMSRGSPARTWLN
jgi:hypothetical protein